MSDIQSAFQYIIIIELLGLSVFPLTAYIFSSFPDKGYAFSKILGLLLSGYSMWILSATHITAFSRSASFAILLLIIVIIWTVALIKKSLTAFPLNTLILIAIEEVMFIGIYAGWTYLRGFSPDINGLEKFMDYGFMLSILRTKYFPPLDHFLSTETINYYYFGHYLASFITNLAKVPAQFGYHLQMSFLMALTAIQSFSLSTAFVTKILEGSKNRMLLKQIGAGLLSASFVTIFGNLHALIYIPIEGISYWYPDATRFIEYTIHEFPIYSFIVNDLHGHVSSIPLVLLVIGLLFTLFTTNKTPELNDTSLIKKFKNDFSTKLYPTVLILLSLTIGALYATNAWDFAIYLLLSGLVLWTKNTLSIINANQKILPSFFNITVLTKTAIESIALLVCSMLFFLPFWAQFHPISQGIGIVPLGSHSPLWQLGVLWGIQVSLSVSYILWIKRNPTQLSEKTNVFILILIALSFLLIILPEIIYVRDIYPTHFRANTMFKFFYQSWLMLGAVVGTTIVILTTKLANGKLLTYAYVVMVSIFIFAGATYGIKATEQGFGGFNGAKKSIDGTAYLDTKYPDDSKAIDWINQNIEGQPVMAEAVGDSYTDYTRIASNTGLPTVIGWPVHEWLWRGSYSDPLLPQTDLEATTGIADTVSTRVEDIKLLYETADIHVIKTLVEKYDIEYIFVGTLEREKYTFNEETLHTMFPTVYENNSTYILKTNIN